jgi:photosystem II cytochrome c550
MMKLFEKFFLKRFFLVVGLIALLVFQISGGQALAVQISESARTLTLNAKGDTIVLSEQQLANGQRMFNKNCAQCHLDGVTKPNPDVSLDPQTLALATPPRNNIEGLVEYLHDPTTYDGFASLEELHPSTKRPDLYPRMRNLTEEDLVTIAGHILSQPKIVGRMWASGKPGR